MLLMCEVLEPEGPSFVLERMRSKYLKAIARLLDMASSEFGSHGCNDLPRDFFDGWTLEERKELVVDMHKKNGDPEEYDE